MGTTRRAFGAGIVLSLAVAWLSTTGAVTVPVLWVDAASTAPKEYGTEASPFRSIARAIASMSGRKTIHVRSGEYRENLELEDGVALVGEGATRPVIRAADNTHPTIYVEGKSSLEFLRITGGNDGILGALGSDLRVADCEIVDNLGDGVFFEKPTTPAARQATIHIEASLVSGNRDGIDVQGNRGRALRCRLVHNRDDGLDIDNDADFEAVENEIHENLDDGIEVRFKSRTLVRLTGNVITGNGEDGIEIIDTPVDGAKDNRAVITNNTVRANRRHGIVGVDHTTENLKPGVNVGPAALSGNVVEGNAKEQVGGFTEIPLQDVYMELTQLATSWSPAPQAKTKTRYAAYLKGAGDCVAKVEVGTTVADGQTIRRFMNVTVRQGPPGATWDVELDGSFVGSVTLGAGGGADMEWDSKQGSLPARFPNGVDAGSRVTLGNALAGSLASAADSAIRRLDAQWIGLEQRRPYPKFAPELKTKHAYVAYLTGAKSGSGRAELEYTVVNGDTIKRAFTVTITDGPPGGAWEIALDGVPFGWIALGEGGGVQMEWTSKHGSFPISFPRNASAGSVVTIDHAFTGKLETRAVVASGVGE